MESLLLPLPFPAAGDRAACSAANLSHVFVRREIVLACLDRAAGAMLQGLLIEQLPASSHPQAAFSAAGESSSSAAPVGAGDAGPGGAGGEVAAGRMLELLYSRTTPRT